VQVQEHLGDLWSEGLVHRLIEYRRSGDDRRDTAVTTLHRCDDCWNPRAGELIHHSDAGSQYTSVRLTEHLALEGIRPSIGTVADAYDNGLMESINGLYKTECIRTTVFHASRDKTIADVEYATAGWVEWYNNRRLHGTLGNVPPIEYENDHHAALNREPQPA